MKRQPAKSFRDLIVWQKAHLFVLEVYKLSGHFPKGELYGLTSQLRRAAVSIAGQYCRISTSRWLINPSTVSYRNLLRS